LFATLCIAVILSACKTQVSTVTPSELEVMKHHYQEPKLSTWYYMGTRDGYHYFSHMDLPREKRYRIAEASLKWPGIVPYTTDQSKWVLLQWGVQDPNFFHDTNFSRTLPGS
jgi:hypothetical protein